MRPSLKVLELHKAIDTCRACPNEVCFDGAERRPETAIVVPGGILVVSQALANATQRKSGVPFFDELGRLGATGRRLEVFLNQLGASLYPAVSIKLASGVEIRAREKGLEGVYNTEAILHFPGKMADKKGDVFPKEVAKRCLEQGFLDKAITLAKPRVVILLGQKTREAVETHWYGQTETAVLSQLITEQKNGLRKVPKRIVAGQEIDVVTIPHPSPLAAGSWNAVFKDPEIIEWLKKVVKGAPKRLVSR